MREDGVSGRLTSGGHELVQRVYYEDTDFSGRVYHARYLQFLERGRSDFLRLLGIHHRDLAKRSLAFAVHRMAITFHRAAEIDDLLTIDTRVASMTGARIVLAQSIRANDARLVGADVTIVMIGPRGQPMRLPDVLRGSLEDTRKDE